MTGAEEVIKLYQLLESHHIPIWLTGGWGIDALLGKQTRPHKDLDVIMLLDDVKRMCDLLAKHGYTLEMLWEENRFAVDSMGNQVATAFVLQHANGCQLDAHAMTLDAHGNGIPAWEEAEDFIFTQAELSGQGVITELNVPCITPESQIKCHTGYELPEKQKTDLALLQAKFGNKSA
ncbi:MAG: nucleotidyltransferase family protein [Anaerolineales bacterium]|nr:nucleotidyltransferase family protein [Anaerolineales bacterium]